MASAKKRRIVNSWNFPEGRLMKCVATRIHDRGLRGRALLSDFQKLVPRDWKSFFPKPMSDDAVVQRADKARRYKNENPETNPRLKPYWRAAGEVVRRGRRLTKANIRAIVRKCESRTRARSPLRDRTPARELPADQAGE